MPFHLSIVRMNHRDTEAPSRDARGESEIPALAEGSVSNIVEEYCELRTANCELSTEY